MRVPQMVSDFFEWRWAPCIGLTAGSLAFVALALLFIPTRLGGERRDFATPSYDTPRPQRALYASSLSPSLTESAERQQDDARTSNPEPQASPQPNETGALRRGFSPIVDRPAPPPAAPVPPPAPVDAPAPPPGTVVITQPVAGGESRESTTQ